MYVTKVLQCLNFFYDLIDPITPILNLNQIEDIISNIFFSLLKRRWQQVKRLKGTLVIFWLS